MVAVRRNLDCLFESRIGGLHELLLSRVNGAKHGNETRGEDLQVYAFLDIGTVYTLVLMHKIART